MKRPPRQLRRSVKQPKAVWTRAFPEQMAVNVKTGLKRKSRRKRELDQYHRRAKAWLLEQKRKQWWCSIGFELFGKRLEVTEVHHRNGRLGSLLLDERFWVAISSQAHDWVHRRILDARKRGWIAPEGQWNKPVPI